MDLGAEEEERQSQWLPHPLAFHQAFLRLTTKRVSTGGENQLKDSNLIDVSVYYVTATKTCRCQHACGAFLQALALMVI